MTNTVRSFGSFCVFFSSSFLIFWPYALILAICTLGFPLYLYWHADFLHHIQLLLNGQLMPSDDISLIFFIPAFILFGTPFLLCANGGNFLACHKALYGSLADSSGTLYGFLGWSLTALVITSMVFLSLWGARQMVGISWGKASSYLIGFAGICALIIWFV